MTACWLVLLCALVTLAWVAIAWGVRQLELGSSWLLRVI